MNPILATPTTLVSGFLGAGKTTLINQLLRAKPAGSQWALLMNEFGQIGIDGSLIDHKDGLAIKEVSGGCICCTSQLPLQIALVRLLTEHAPSRLLIEPTGLAHADELTEQLSAAHWQTSLQLHAIICVLSVAQWQNTRYREHTGYIAHVRHADVVVYNRSDLLSDAEIDTLHQWVSAINPTAQLIDADTLDTESLNELLHLLHQPKQVQQRVSLAALSPQRPKLSMTANDDTAPTDITLPYRYHERSAGFSVGGWRLPSAWVFDSYALQKWLLSRPDYLRIKGVIHTNEGWLALNITHESISISDAAAQADSKLELIFSDALDADAWTLWDGELMAMVKA